jgi:hypothetical protein
MKVRMPTPLGHTSTMASIGASKPALHIARNPLPPFNRSAGEPPFTMRKEGLGRY